MRRGFTTGTCATAAAAAAAVLLLRGQAPATVSVRTPGGIDLVLDVLQPERGADSASCAIRKDAGDDPDITDGALIIARIRRIPRGIELDGGTGIGRVTRPGLDQPVGAAAINRVPREMIARHLREVSENCGYSGGLSVVLEIPGGDELARRTFNPRLGITGGLSILGTSGLVEPMSHQAMADTIRLRLRQLRAGGAHTVLLTPGNYGETFAREELGLSMTCHINCANFIGDAIDAAVELGFKRILLVGHIGKLVKLGIGVPNTHSAFGDGRMETLLACALRAGAGLPLLAGILECATTDAALDLLWAAGLLEPALAELGRRIEDFLTRRVPAGIALGYLCYTNASDFAGVLIKNDQASDLMKLLEDKQ